MKRRVEDKVIQLVEREGKGLEELTFLGKIHERDVVEYEKEKNVRFPEQYRDFLIKYGSMDFGFEVKGCYIDSEGEMVFDREEEYEYYHEDLRLGEKHCVLKDVDEFAYVIHLESGEAYNFGKYEKGEDEYILEYEDFNSYLCDMIEEYTSNLD